MAKVFYIPYTITKLSLEDYVYNHFKPYRGQNNPIYKYEDKVLRLLKTKRDTLFPNIKDGDIIESIKGLPWNEPKGKFIFAKNNLFSLDLTIISDELFELNFPPDYWDNIAPVNWRPRGDIHHILRELFDRDFHGKQNLNEYSRSEMLTQTDCQCPTCSKTKEVYQFYFGNDRWTFVMDKMCDEVYTKEKSFWPKDKSGKFKSRNRFIYSRAPRFSVFTDMPEKTVYLSQK